MNILEFFGKTDSKTQKKRRSTFTSRPSVINLNLNYDINLQFKDNAKMCIMSICSREITNFSHKLTNITNNEEIIH